LNQLNNLHDLFEEWRISWTRRSPRAAERVRDQAIPMNLVTLTNKAMSKFLHFVARNPLLAPSCFALDFSPDGIQNTVSKDTKLILVMSQDESNKKRDRKVKIPLEGGVKKSHR
jgi:hypothetical protein